MSSSEFRAYQEEILNFLKSVTLKYQPFESILNNSVIEKGYEVDLARPLSWKYYVNMAGEYHPSDTIMTIRSLDTQQLIEFRKDVLKKHPRTLRHYQPGTPYYSDLCKRYKDQTDLIKNILYPVTDIEAAYNAPNFTILNYASGYLETEEEPYILLGMKTFLKYAYNRWYHNFLQSELYFHQTYYAQIWLLLFSCIMKERIALIKTAHAHSYHIWEYLKSHGIGDYKDILSKRQALFLYRNMRYLKEHRGKMSNMIILADALLSESNIALVSKTVRQQTSDISGSYKWIPEFTSEKVPTVYADFLRTVAPQDVSEILYKIYNLGYEELPTYTHIQAVTDTLGATNHNALPTKFFEIYPIGLDREFEFVFFNYIADTLVYLVSNNMYSDIHDITDPELKISFRLGTKDALLLLIYLLYESNNMTLDKTFFRYSPAYVYREDYRDVSIPEFINYSSETSYRTENIIDAETYIGEEILYPLSRLTSNAELIDYLDKSFSTYMQQLMIMRHAAAYTEVYAYREILDLIGKRSAFSVKLTDKDTYTEWLDQSHLKSVKTIIDTYRKSDSASKLYMQLADLIFDILVPTTDNVFSKYITLSKDSNFYKKTKQLFIQLCSYDILIFDTEKTVLQARHTPKIMTDFRYVTMDADIFYSNIQLVTQYRDERLDDQERLSDTMISSDYSKSMHTDPQIRVYDTVTIKKEILYDKRTIPSDITLTEIKNEEVRNNLDIFHRMETEYLSPMYIEG